MKTRVSIALASAFLVQIALAQTPPQELDQSWNKQTAQAAAKSVVFQAEMVRRVFGLEVQVSGSLPKAFRTGNPLQAINPLAPPEFGDGFDNVSVDPETGQVLGWRLLDIRF